MKSFNLNASSQQKSLKKCCCAVVLFFVVLMFLFVLADVDFNGPSKNNFVASLKSNNLNEAAQRTPRVVFVVVQTSVSPGWCRMMMSSVLSNVSVVSIGLGAKYSHTDRPGLLTKYIDDEGLHDSDVLVTFDGGDTFFSGPAAVKQAVDNFLATTAPTEATFDASAVDKGEATPPLIFHSDSECWTAQIDLVVRSGPSSYRSKCAWYYKRVQRAVDSNPGQRLGRSPQSGYQYLSGGGAVGRVWAFRKAVKVYNKLLAKHRRWWCDQTIWALLYIWSVTKDPAVDPELRIPYGVLGLDYNNSFFFLLRTRYFGTHAIIHIPGVLHDWTTRLPGLLTHTSWFGQLRDSSNFVNKAKRLLRRTSVRMKNISGESVSMPLANFCPVDKVVNHQWVVRTQKKA